MINEDEARVLWRRAAELQATAESRSSEPRSLVPLAEDQSAFTEEAIVHAAEEAGIDAEYMRIALVEHGLPGAAGYSRNDWTRVLHALVAYETDAVERFARINATPQDVLNALSRLLSRQPYRLTLASTFGDDPLKDGMLVYRLSTSRWKKFQPTGTAFEKDINVADGRFLLITVRQADEDDTRLSIRMPLFRRRENVALWATCAGAFGWFGTALAPYIAGWTSMTPGLSALITGLLGAAGIVTGTGIYRQIYRWATRKGEAALDRVLQSASSEVRAAIAPRASPTEE